MNTSKNLAVITKRKVITSFIAILLLLFTLVPTSVLAEAQADEPGYSVTITDPGSIDAGSQINMQATKVEPEGTTTPSHIDWSIVDAENHSSTATLNKHAGLFTAISAGEVTVQAILREGEPVSGQGMPNNVEPGRVLATTQIAVEVVSTAENTYGYQGLGGNSMLMTNPSQVYFLDTDTNPDDQKTIYKNLVYSFMPVSTDGSVTFGYTMSAGINNFQKETFDKYRNDIKLYDEAGKDITVPYVKDGQTPQPTIDLAGFADGTVSIDVSGLAPEGEYTLEFGPSVCGNNIDKKLDSYVQFNFFTPKEEIIN